MTPEMEAARLVRAALAVIRENLPGGSALDATVSRWQTDVNNIIDGLDDTTSSAPVTVEIRWADVVTGDKVIAPNGVIYTVDAVTQTGALVKAMLDHPGGGDTVGTSRNAGDKVMTERGDTGKAIDMFTAAGMTMEVVR